MLAKTQEKTQSQETKQASKLNSGMIQIVEIGI